MATKAPQKDPSKALNETTASIKKLVLSLENREREGKSLSAIEIQKLANQLQVHVEDLLAASRNVRDEKTKR